MVALLTRGRLSLTCLTLTLLLSLPAISDRLLHRLDLYPPLPPERAAAGGAIVILSAEATPGPETSPPQPGALTLIRLRQGAALARASHRPVLVTGGAVEGLSESLGAVMRRSLETDFQVGVTWSETASRNTHENAALSAPLLRAAGIDTIVLVTHFWHMPRAVLEFERQGLKVIPAPAGCTALPPLTGWRSWIPSVKAWQAVYFAAHEAGGILWFRLMPP